MPKLKIFMTVTSGQVQRMRCWVNLLRKIDTSDTSATATASPKKQPPLLRFRGEGNSGSKVKVVVEGDSGKKLYEETYSIQSGGAFDGSKVLLT